MITNNKILAALVGHIKWLSVVLSLAVASTSVFASAINLRNSDISLFIETVAEITGKNFIIDPRVKGNVTVVATAPMSNQDIYDVFLSVMDVHGFVALPEGKAIKIVPNINSRFAGSGDGKGIAPGSLVTQVIQVQEASAKDLVPLLRPLLPLETHLAAFEKSNQLVVSSTRNHVQRLASLVQRLDKSGQSYSQVIRLAYANALEVEALLLKLQQTPAGQVLANMAVVADERTNSVILMHTKPIEAGVLEVIADLDKSVPQTQAEQQAIKVHYLKYADADRLAPIIERIALGGAASQSQEGDANKPTLPVSVQADQQLNALIIAAPSSLMMTLEGLIAQLDVRRAQILVEAVIAEISSTHAAELGMQWALAGNGIAGATNFADSSLINLVANPLTLGSGMTLGVGKLPLEGADGMATILRALNSDADTNIVSTPSVVTLDNEEAEIVVGQNVPFVTGQYTNPGANSGSTTNAPFQTIQRENVGVKLKILPKINDGDAISLSITQEVSSLSAQSISASDVVTNTRTIDTTVIASDGDLVVLGGLIDDQMVDTTEKVPLLGDLPVLGAAFRYQKSNLAKRNLVVFIRPTIVRDASLLESLSHEKYQFLRAKQILLNQSQGELFQGMTKPLLGEPLPAKAEPEAIEKSKANW
ncbi:MAG TPA: type II secretion system protein GspD [Oceanospirillaceae bacterium]|nr:type II secretion system protein GspD [Oceanospirillaceae bacterium]